MFGLNELTQGYEIIREDGLVELSKGVQRYYSNPHHMLENWIMSKYYIREAKKYQSQKSKIHDLISENKFVLIILDACRYDLFKNLHSNYITGELENVWSEGSKTPQWIPRTWENEYNITYVSGAPYMSKDRQLSEEYEPDEHFDEIKHVWATDWDGKRFTTKPSAITNAALTEISRNEQPRVVVHHMQPHQPYIADETGEFMKQPRIPAWNMSETTLSPEEVYERSHPSVDNKVDLPRNTILDKIKNGNLTITEWKKAYEANLEAVLKETKNCLNI